MVFSPLSKNETLLYKGIAILMIVVHNFMHLFPSPKEMEFSFYNDRFEIFLNSLMEPLDLIRVLFSYFGHYGVQIFIFLSAYGLTKRYINDDLLFAPFIKKRLLTIYPSFILAFLLYALITPDYQAHGLLAPLKYVYWAPEEYFYKLFMLSNFIPGQEFKFVGPWWFISFIFQFYLIFTLLLYLYDRFKGSGLLFLSLLTIFINQLTNGNIAGTNLYFTIIGHLPEFCLGIFFAKLDNKELVVPEYVLFLFIFIFYLGNVYELFWHVSHFSFLIISLMVLNKNRNNLRVNSSLRKAFLFLGGISMPLFLVNGFLREPFLSIAVAYDQWFLTILLSFISLYISIFVAYFLQKTEFKIKKIIGY